MRPRRVASGGGSGKLNRGYQVASHEQLLRMCIDPLGALHPPHRMVHNSLFSIWSSSQEEPSTHDACDSGQEPISFRITDHPREVLNRAENSRHGRDL